MKLNFLLVGGIAGLLTLCAYASYLWLLPLSYSNLSAHDPRLALIIPKSVRQITPPSLCAPLRYDRDPIECGGICGTAYRLSFGTTLNQASLKKALDLPSLKRELGAQEIDLFTVGEHDCRSMQLNIYFDERMK
jgi:hypothetical protein